MPEDVDNAAVAKRRFEATTLADRLEVGEPENAEEYDDAFVETIRVAHAALYILEGLSEAHQCDRPVEQAASAEYVEEL